MKKITIYLLLFICIFTGCVNYAHLVKNNVEYVPIEKLDLSEKQKFILKLRTNLNSPYVIYNHRTGMYYYNKMWDYSKIVIIKK